MEEVTEEDARRVARLIGRGMLEAMRSEDFAALRAWVAREAPRALPQFGEGAGEHGLRAGANAVATTIWNLTPLRSNGYRPRPLPPPGRNDPCPCGSGAKFKRCCGRVGPHFPAISAEESRLLLATEATDDELVKLIEDRSLPPELLAVVAHELNERDPDAADQVLEPWFADPASLDRHHEAALEIWLEIQADVRDAEEFVGFGLRLAEDLTPALRPAVWRALMPAAIAMREIRVAEDLLARLRESTPDDPALAPLEISMLLAAGETARAAQRARFWLSWLRRRGLEDEMGEAWELLQKTARDPEEAAREIRAIEQPYLAELANVLVGTSGRPIRAYPLDLRDGAAVLNRPAQDVLHAEQAWASVWPRRKPALVDLDADIDASVLDEPEPWLALLRQRPEALDSLDVLDDLVFLASAGADLDPGWDKPVLSPLLDRAAAIVRASAAAAPGCRLPWCHLENRPGLRLLSHLGLQLEVRGLRDAAAAVLEEVMALNPGDNHGHRTWLIDHYLRSGAEARALALAPRFEDDVLVETMFGHGLALWRLGRRPEAEEVLRKAAAKRPRVAGTLSAASEPDVPELLDGRVRLGGEDEAWLYREDMLDVWRQTPEALELLRGLSRAVAAPRERRR